MSKTASNCEPTAGSDGGRQSEQDSFISDEFGDMMCDREGSDSWWRDWSDSGDRKQSF